MPDTLSAAHRKAVANHDIDRRATETAGRTSRATDGPTKAEHPRNTANIGERPAWREPPLPNGAKRTYLTSGGAAVVAVVFLVFVAILLAWFSSAATWSPW
jgi:hypothetical protein